MEKILILLTFLGALSVPINGEFNRICNTAVQCVFSPARSGGRVYLDCIDGQCACANFERIANVPKWNLTEDPRRAPSCLIAEFGLCGSDKGLEIGCEPGFYCVDARCRSLEKIGTLQKDMVCYNDNDCETGLKCAVTKNLGSRSHRTCQTEEPEQEEEEQPRRQQEQEEREEEEDEEEQEEEVATEPPRPAVVVMAKENDFVVVPRGSNEAAPVLVPITTVPAFSKEEIEVESRGMDVPPRPEGNMTHNHTEAETEESHNTGSSATAAAMPILMSSVLTVFYYFLSVHD